MMTKLQIKLIRALLSKYGTTQINVSGNSMQPTLFNGDVVTVKQENVYKDGDIIVFEYKNELIIHRLLSQNQYICLCKGDNSFKVEDIDFSQILGRVVDDGKRPLPCFNKELIDLSLELNFIYRKNCYNAQAVIKSDIYKKYKMLLINLCSNTCK